MITWFSFSRVRLSAGLILLALLAGGCGSSANSRFFGKTMVSADNILRYVSGGEPQSLDPQIVTGQGEARICLALYDGLVEYHPKTMQPIPAIAETWEISPDGTEFLFHLRRDAKFSDGAPITAKDFVYSFRRALSPELASASATQAYPIKYAEAYNSGASFVKNADGSFLLKNDLDQKSAAAPAASTDNFGGQTEFHKFLDAPERLTVKTDEKARAKQLEADPQLKSLVEGKELISVKAEDLGVEAVDDYTFRLKLYQSTPYMLGLLAHQFFRVVPRQAIEKHGRAWTRPENIVTSGAFKLGEHRPYNRLVVIKDSYNWDARNVKLAGIEFYPMEEATTIMNLYKAGSVDAVFNHTVPAAWLDQIKPQYGDEYLNFPEVSTEFYLINIKHAPMDNLKVRQAFALAIDRETLAKFRKTVKPLVNFSPEGVFPEYEAALQKIEAEKLKELKITADEWKKRIFDPEKARKLMTEAGYPVEGAPGAYRVPSFQKFIDDGSVSITYNSSESNKAIAEFVQAQWRQNLGITVPLKNLEQKTYLPMINNVEYKGFGRRGWSGDYMDPFTFLNLFYTASNDGGTGWTDKKYDELLTRANNTIDPQTRYELMAEAEFYVMQQQIVIPLYIPATNWMKKPYVKGLYPNPGTLHAWKFVRLESDPARWDANVDNLITEKDPVIEEQLSRLESSQKQFEETKAAPGE